MNIIGVDDKKTIINTLEKMLHKIDPDGQHMTLKDIAVKFDLDREEQAIFTEYTRNRFDDIEEITAPDSGFLVM